MVRNIVRQIARNHGVAFYEADSLEAARAILEREHIDLLITGLELQDAHGEDLVKFANGLERDNLYVVVVTSDDTMEVRERMFSLGVVDYLLKKDFASGMLEEYLERFLRPDNVIAALQDTPVAVLDDSKVVRRVIQRTLQAFGVEKIDAFGSAEELLASGKSFGLYLIDVVLPDMTGPEVIRKIRETDKTAAIIAVSSIGNVRTVASVLQAGADDYITKPFDSYLFMARARAAFRPRILSLELEEKNKLLADAARHDGLTHAMNHGETKRVLGSLVEAKTDVAIALIDIDRFRSINDEYGHDVADKHLKQLVETARSHFEPPAAIGRLGEDTFLIVAPGTKPENLVSKTNAFREAVKSKEIAGSSITVSIGVTSKKGGELRSGSAMLEEADNAMYQAKHDGGNRVSW